MVGKKLFICFPLTYEILCGTIFLKFPLMSSWFYGNVYLNEVDMSFFPTLRPAAPFTRIRACEMDDYALPPPFLCHFLP